MPDPAKIILTVDDDPNVSGVIKSQLEREAYSVICVTNSEKALEIIQEAKLFAVLLDLHLNGPRDGFKLLEMIKRFRPNLSVIVVTGSHDEEEARRTFELGAWDYVTKPIDFNYLKSILLLLPNQT